MICVTCGTKEFIVHDGISFCTECYTQIQDELNWQTDTISSTRKTLLSSPTSKDSKSKEVTKYSEWITVEAYNNILVLQVEALIKLGASPKLKPTVFHIWSKYLQKCEIAFREDCYAGENKPRLGPVPAKRDLKVLYGDQTISVRKRKKSLSKSDRDTEAETTVSAESGSSDEFLSDSCSNASSTSKSSKPKYSSPARKLLRKKKLSKSNKNVYDEKVFNMNLKKTLSFCYLGLLYTEDTLGLSDLIRFACEQRIPFINIIDKLPPEMNLQHADTMMFLAYSVPDLLRVHKTALDIVKFLNLPKFKPQSIHLAVSRILKNLNLPDDLKPMIKVLFDKFSKRSVKPEAISTDLLALSLIIVVLKMLFVIDGKFENDHSNVMAKLNANYPDKNYFVYAEWRDQAALKEYIFLTENPRYCTVNKLDSLCADRMISQYPYTSLKPPSTEDALRCRNKTVSKYEIKTILSSIIRPPSTSEIPPSSFPMISAVTRFENEWRELPMFRETNNIDFTFLKKDFSSCSLLYNPLRISQEDECSSELLTSLYMPKSSDGSNIKLSEAVLSDCTTGKYWFFNTHRDRVDAGVVAGDWNKKIPSAFKWLLDFFSKCTFISSLDLYLQVVKIEKLLFIGKKNFMPCMLPVLK